MTTTWQRRDCPYCHSTHVLARLSSHLLTCTECGFEWDPGKRRDDS